MEVSARVHTSRRVSTGLPASEQSSTIAVEDQNPFEFIQLLDRDHRSSCESMDHPHSKRRNYPCLYLNSQLPNRVLSLDASFETTFGFKKEELQRSLRMIAGPNTDMKGFNDLISTCLRDLQSERTLIFYKKNGDEVKCNVKGNCTLFEGSVAARLEFETSVSEDEEEAVCTFFDINTASKSDSSKKETDPSGDLAPRADIDPAVIIHMKAVQRAAQAAKRDERQQGS